MYTCILSNEMSYLTQSDVTFFVLKQMKWVNQMKRVVVLDGHCAQLMTRCGHILIKQRSHCTRNLTHRSHIWQIDRVGVLGGDCAKQMLP